MSVESYNFKGKIIYIVSENDLMHVKKIGGQIRACCPIHNSRDRDASIRPWSPDMSNEDAWLAGWGYCHGGSCNAEFLVKEWNPRKVRHITGKHVEAVVPKIQLTAKELEQADEARRAELAALSRIQGAMRKGLQHPRAQAYLAQRGIAHMMDLLTRLEIGYIPRAEEWKSPPPAELRKWCDRLIFPYTTAEGERGYAGRTLCLWVPGMDENEHKKVLDAHNADETHKYHIRRWEKTYRSGLFNIQGTRGHRHVYIMEGTFDILPALFEGIPNVVAACGQNFDVTAFPKTVLEVTMAFDADGQGQEAAKKVKNIFENLGREGISYNYLCAPDDGRGKDWSERYRLHGREGLAVLFKPEPLKEQSEGCAICGVAPLDGEENQDTEFYSDEQGRLYCQDHWAGPLPDTQVRLPDGRIVPAATLTPPVPTQALEPETPQSLGEQERVAARAHMIAQALQVPCAVSPVEAIVTLQEHMAVQKVAQAREVEARIQRAREIRAGRYRPQGGVA